MAGLDRGRLFVLPGFVLLLLLLMALTGTAQAEFVDPLAVLESLPPPSVEYPVASPVRLLRPVSELIHPRNPPPPAPETKPVEPFLLPSRPRKVAIASDSHGAKAHATSAKAPASGTPSTGGTILDRILGSLASGAFPASFPGRVASPPLVAKRDDKPAGKEASGTAQLVSQKGKPEIASGTAFATASGTVQSVASRTAAVTASAVASLAVASDTGAASGVPVVGVASEAGEGGEGVPETGETGEVASATPEEVLQELIQKGAALCEAGKLDEVKGLLGETPALAETADGVGWGILIQLGQKKPNYASIRSASERLLAMEGQSRNPVGHWGLANALLNGRKPDPDLALKSLEIVKTSKKAPAGAGTLYWTTRAKKQWYVGLILLAALVGGADQIKKRRAKAAAAKLEAALAEGATEAQETPPTVEAAASIPPKSGSRLPEALRARIQPILDKLNGFIQGKKEQIEKLPAGKTIWKTLSRATVTVVVGGTADEAEGASEEPAEDASAEASSEEPASEATAAADESPADGTATPEGDVADEANGGDEETAAEAEAVAEAIEEVVSETVAEEPGESNVEGEPDETREGT